MTTVIILNMSSHFPGTYAAKANIRNETGYILIPGHTLDGFGVDIALIKFLIWACFLIICFQKTGMEKK